MRMNIFLRNMERTCESGKRKAAAVKAMLTGKLQECEEDPFVFRLVVIVNR